MVSRFPFQSSAVFGSSGQGRRRVRLGPIRIPLVFNLFTIMSAITMAVIAAVTIFFYVEGRAVAESTGRALSREVTAKVAQQVEGLFSPAAVLTDLSSALPRISQPPDLLVHPMGWYIMRALESYTPLYSAYMGFEDGRFYQIISVPQAVPEEGRAAREAAHLRAATIRLGHGAPPDTRFIHRAILPRPGGDRVEIWTFLDAGRILLGSRVEKRPAYDPRLRPWYREARQTHGTVMTGIYTFASLGVPGITLARPFDGDISGVFGIDLTLGGIVEFLERQSLSPNGRLLVANNDGQVIAFKGPDGVRTGAEFVRGRPLTLAGLHDPAIVRALYDSTANADVQLLEGRNNDPDLLARRIDVALAGERGLLVAMASPLSDFTGPVDDLIADSVLFALLVGLLGVPLIWIMARRMSAALRLLADDAGRIKALNLEGETRVRTIVGEVQDLAEAQRTMKESLRTFGLFVPRDLVRQIVAAGGSAEPGGQRQDLTVLFSDIANFTTISEATPPEDLMIRTSLYFEEMTAAITPTGGTIDKFIGDAVMALWNAPLPLDDHVARGCMAALEAARRIAEFNTDLMANGYPAFHTRFGLHVGDAVVGNVGSSARMDYSAIGATVNTASRVEGLNKAYGTTILISEAVLQRIGRQFVTREVDWVQPKGATEPLCVHQLVGVHPDHAEGVDPALVVDAAWVDRAERWAALRATLARDHDWAAVCAGFKALADEAPDDGLAAHFAALSDRLAADPEAAAQWTEVRRMETK